uniref:Fibrinogen C-terminal domain-containing protein n=1 Tax=Amphimedon queenslandica TaxID=400682 RepID=A0A1X7SDQ9_AMPQE
MMKFTTKDRDNDVLSTNCATRFSAAWWYKNCYRAHLNSPYFHSGTVPSDGKGIIWHHWKGFTYSLKFTEMKVRHHN